MPIPPATYRFNGFLCFIFLAASTASQAQSDTQQEEWVAPSSPHLYESSMGQGSTTMSERISIGPLLRFGQSRSTGSESASTGITAGIQAGYSKNLGNWTMLRGYFEAWSGKAGHGDVDIMIPIGILAGVKLGTILNSQIVASLGFSAGVFQANYDSIGAVPKISGSSLGNIFQILADLDFPLSSVVTGTVGLSYNHLNAAFGNLKAGALTVERTNVALNLWAAQFGLNVVL